MKVALFIVLIVEAIWFPFGHIINGMHKAYMIPDWTYFWLMFPLAAIVDYVAIQCLSLIKTAGNTSQYVDFLIILFATSMAAHLFGAYGFITDSTAWIGVYDAAGVIILLLEIGVFIAYGLFTLHSRERIHNRVNSKGRS